MLPFIVFQFVPFVSVKFWAPFTATKLKLPVVFCGGVTEYDQETSSSGHVIFNCAISLCKLATSAMFGVLNARTNEKLSERLSFLSTVGVKSAGGAVLQCIVNFFSEKRTVLPPPQEYGET